jgi:hypothetical protein
MRSIKGTQRDSFMSYVVPKECIILTLTGTCINNCSKKKLKILYSKFYFLLFHVIKQDTKYDITVHAVINSRELSGFGA